MESIVVTGSCGLIGRATAELFCKKGYRVYGIDNDARRSFFGVSNAGNRLRHKNYKHFHLDLTDTSTWGSMRNELPFLSPHTAIVHTAAQPSHGWAAKSPLKDFAINTQATIHLLEKARHMDVPFVFTSTNKVYGDRPNLLNLQEEPTRWDLHRDHDLWDGIKEDMGIDQSTHTVFGANKAAADLMVQEYGHSFGLDTVCFRLSCVTGERHKGVEQHGFLSYLFKCAKEEIPYTVCGFKGKQVRSNIHADDVAKAIFEYLQNPKPAVYNLGGGRDNSCSVLEAISLAEETTNKKMFTKIVDDERLGDHQWYIDNTKKFRDDYPNWKVEISLQEIADRLTR